MKIPGSQPSNRPVMAESTTELLILADGKILVHNLTPAFADLLTQLNPEIGDHDTYDRWVNTLRARRMGHIIDLVPNHMGIAHSSNPWWQDVLENGPSSRYAQFFDIDWHPLKPELEDKVLLPILGDSYGAVLERQEIKLQYVSGAFKACYGDNVLPISPGTYDKILGVESEALLAELGETDGGGTGFTTTHWDQ